MKIRVSTFALPFILPFLYGVTCVTELPPPPPRLRAPAFVEGKVVAAKWNKMVKEMVYLQWSPPDSDSAAVREYVILQKLPFDTSIDTLGVFPSEPEHLPAQKTFAYELTDNIRQYSSSNVTSLTLYYQIFAVDSLERSSDTSARLGVTLLENVDLQSPRDTLVANAFTWRFVGIADEIFTNMEVWGPNDSVPMYISDTTNDLGYLFDWTSYTRSLPADRYPLPPGVYSWAVRMEQPTASATSFTIGTFSAP